jgi:hypothetical protein
VHVLAHIVHNVANIALINLIMVNVRTRSYPTKISHDDEVGVTDLGVVS